MKKLRQKVTSKLRACSRWRVTNPAIDQSKVTTTIRNTARVCVSLSMERLCQNYQRTEKGPQHRWALSSIDLRAGLVGSARSQRASDQERLARLRSFRSNSACADAPTWA